MGPARLWNKINGGDVANVSFADFERLLEAFGFELRRRRGSHRLYRHPHKMCRLNLQPQGGQAKVYQIRQFLELVERYDLGWRDER